MKSSSAKRWVFASNNTHKIKEIKEMLGESVEILSPAEVGFLEDIPETADTFEGNALLKAQALYAATGIPTFADDSGLAVSALDGRPGVYSARYAGERATSRDNCKKLLEELQGVANRDAAFVCVIAFTDGQQTHYFRGEIKGKIIDEMQGYDGFGYDPIFVPEGYTDTFAQMPSAQKNSMSHRSRAVEILQEELLKPE
jgi:XTP/dITP diphosphohydrolase